MDLEVLTERQREIYTQVEDYRKKNPDASNMHILKELNLNPSTYAAAKARLRQQPPGPAQENQMEMPMKRKYVRRAPQMITIPVEEPRQSANIVAFVGDSKSVVDSVNQFLKGR